MTEEENQEQIAQKISEAVDLTTDDVVLGKLWEITKIRYDSEKHRSDSANDRASKCITYAFSILALAGFSSVFTKDLIKDAFTLNSCLIYSLLGVTAILYVVVLGFAFKAWKSATDVLDIKAYKTWDEKDLSRVELGDGNNEEKEHGYLRFIIKATWAILLQNESQTDIKLETVKNSLQALRNTLKVALLVIITASVTNVLIAKKLTAINNKEVLCMSSDPKNKPLPQAPKPTPTPTQGVTERRSISNPPMPPKPIHSPIKKK